MTRFNLPVFKSSGPAVSDRQLVHRTYNAQTAADMALADTATLDFGVALYSVEFPEVWAANHMADVSLGAADDPAAGMAEVEALFARHGTMCHKWKISPHNENLRLPLYLTEAGWRKSVHRVYALKQVQPLDVRSDLTLIPIRASLRKFSELSAVLLAEYGETADMLNRAFERHFDDPHMDGFLALDGTEAVGLITLFTDGDLGYISDLDVHPAHRRKKVGATLLMQVFELAARCRHRYVTLYTDEGNAGAISLYERAGFVFVGAAETYMRPGPTLA